MQASLRNMSGDCSSLYQQPHQPTPPPPPPQQHSLDHLQHRASQQHQLAGQQVHENHLQLQYEQQQQQQQRLYASSDSYAATPYEPAAAQAGVRQACERDENQQLYFNHHHNQQQQHHLQLGQYHCSQHRHPHAQQQFDCPANYGLAVSAETPTGAAAAELAGLEQCYATGEAGHQADELSEKVHAGSLAGYVTVYAAREPERLEARPGAELAQSSAFYELPPEQASSYEPQQLVYLAPLSSAPAGLAQDYNQGPSSQDQLTSYHILEPRDQNHPAPGEAQTHLASMQQQQQQHYYHPSSGQLEVSSYVPAEVHQQHDAHLCTSDSYAPSSQAALEQQASASSANSDFSSGSELAESLDSTLTRDEKKAREANIPLSYYEIVNLSIDQFNEHVAKFSFTEAQLTLMKDIRRRGKNKVAAQTCRKRKMEQISELQLEVNHLIERKVVLGQQRVKLEHEQQRLIANYDRVYAIIRHHLDQKDLIEQSQAQQLRQSQQQLKQATTAGRQQDTDAQLFQQHQSHYHYHTRHLDSNQADHSSRLLAM